MISQSDNRLKVTKVKKLKEIEEKPAVVSQFYQTKLCKHFQNGSCLYGDKCSFSHSYDQLRERPNLTKTKMCTAIESGLRCTEGDKCPFAHSVSELRATPMLYRTVLCNWWRKGQCEFGDSCRFAHGEEQLRSASPSLSPSESMSKVSSEAHSLNQMSTAVSTPACGSLAMPSEPSGVVDMPEIRPSVNFVTPSPMYAAIFSAALSAATTAAMHHGVSVLTPEQTAAVAAAAAAAANEAIKQYAPPVESDEVQPRTTSAPVTNEAAKMREELKKFKKGFSSSPALLTFFDDEEEEERDEENLSPDLVESFGRPRADSEPGLRVTERLMEEIRKLWILPEDEGGAGFGSTAHYPVLSASHVTLDGFTINLD